MTIDYDALKEMRVERRIYLHEMADALGLRTPGGYSRIETGENELKAKHIPVIASKFGMNVYQFAEKIFNLEVEHSSTSVNSIKEVI